MIRLSADIFVLLYFAFIYFMLARNTLTEFTNFFRQKTLKKWWYNFKIFYKQCLKMDKYNSIEHDYVSKSKCKYIKWATTLAKQNQWN